jgi:Family of unknown function (DUF6152)
MTRSFTGRLKAAPTLVVVLQATVLFLGANSPVTAHHGQAGLFDETKVVELKGTVKKWSLVNPHPILVLEVTDQGGTKTDWDVYFGPSAAGPLRRQGYTPETFRPGETVVVKAHPSTGAEVHGVDVWGRGVGVTREDGKPVP